MLTTQWYTSLIFLWAIIQNNINNQVLTQNVNYIQNKFTFEIADPFDVVINETFLWGPKFDSAHSPVPRYLLQICFHWNTYPTQWIVVTRRWNTYITWFTQYFHNFTPHIRPLFSHRLITRTYCVKNFESKFFIVDYVYTRRLLILCFTIIINKLKQYPF